jgi:hypothetical protein
MGNLLLLLPVLILFLACEEERRDTQMISEKQVVADSNQVVLEFSLDVNRTVYQKTNFGEPPQLAIWIESADSQVIKTVWVSRRAAKNDWKGKVECPVALPYWESKIAKETGATTLQKRRETQFEAVSGATPKAGRFAASIMVPPQSSWNYFIEVNVSADYNQAFPYWSKEGLPDSQANGQPSLVYSGRMVADGSSNDIPRLIGRTEQRHATNSLFDDLSGITSANQLIENITVASKP